MDKEALKLLILDNLKDLRRFAYSLTNDINDADDLTQIVVEKLLTKPIPDNVEPLPWIFRVCKNAWIDELRSRKIRTIDDNVEVSQIESSTKSSEIAEDNLQQLKIAITELPEAYRVVMSLIIISGLSYAETAEVLEIPIGTVMSRVARAREKLSQMLNKYGVGEQ
ncbi:RNA polymerase sigma factor [Glaciecola sp. XM2]|uniref:RNA polymerase sigma factor n=1 Tax=Glaciecola sp. XM2 TaxID=1914931 RepID=UPI001BDE8047|nr:RNA polymerase sigma factor [Glaciecola sp. XM2]MBT1450093.1 RNA polymerase sigma factor [Glaciecola sp. XM2]